jgi:hypothetical protein
MKSIYQSIMKFSGVLSLFGISACSYQTPLAPPPGKGDAHKELAERVHARPELAVLFVGNSYSFGVPRAFSKLANAGGQQVRVGHSTFGGWTLKRHAGEGSTLKKIREGGWDVVVLQEQSEIPAKSTRECAAQMFPPLRLLVTEIRSHGAIPVLYQTWGRRDGDPHTPQDNFAKMNGRLREGYLAAARNSGGVLIAPVGDAWEREISNGHGNELFMPDGSHPTQHGSDLTASVFYETFFMK